MQSSVHMDFNRRKLASQLCDAVNDGDPRCVQMLLSKGASPDLVGSKGVAAIHLAVGKETEKNIRCLKMLLQNGADPNIRSSEGLTPLHVAALWGCYQNLKLLLINGGNPNVKDNDGNTPGQLAEQQENLKCSHLLQEYQLSSADTEEEDLPQFQYSMYSDQADVSGYPESNYSFTSHSSRISDFSDVPLSSTRFSSVFNLSSTSGRPSWRGLSFNRPPGTSVLSSTRLSALEPAVNMSVLKEDPSCGERAKATEHAATSNGMISPSGGDCLPEFSSRQVRQKSVSFRNVDELFPVFSPESPKQNLGGEGYSSTLPFDLSEYSDFLDSERLATVFPKQGLDVTSPDHVYVFCRESSEDTEESLEKTIVSHVPSEVSDDELEGQNDKEPQVEPSEKKAHIASSSSGTGSSHYSSCESDHYTSCLDASQHRLFPSAGAESEDKNIISDQAEPRPETAEPLSGLINKLTLSKEIPPKDPLKASLMDTLSKEEQETDVRSDATEMFTPSPFVTGRTRSRLSRCSMRTSRTHDSKLCTSSLFEDTLPTPIRMFRQTPRSSHTPDCTSEHSGRSKEGNSLPSDGHDTQSSPFGSASISNSQADTLILPKSVHDSVDQSGTLADTVLLDKTQDNSVDSYEKNLAEIILAVREQNKGIPEGKGFLTDDLTSADDSGDQLGTLADTIILEKTQDNSVDSYEKNLAEIILAVREQNKEVPEDEDVLTEDLTSKDEGNVNDASCEDLVDSLKNKDAWITEDSISQSDSGSSSSSSCYFSPRRSKESSDPPCTPGTGCTPRYSMSRLSSCRRPQRLADLSFTPGGRPLIQDLDEPVEYLYTDTEQGHKLIETHVPPTLDTSLSYSTNTTSSDETVLYDWRSLQAEMKSNKEKENQQPKEVTEEKNTNSDHWLLETRGITDKELRLRLVELGESPGPISSQTRPTYVKRLRYLLQESDSQQPKKQLNQQQAVNLGYSPELRWVLQTFQLPDCHADEQILSHQFDQPDQNRKWREGVIKSSFNYLLLDPRVTKNLPFRSHSMSPHECFQSFIHAIFYVGKGKRSRPYSHLYEALEYYRGEKTSTKLCPKVQHILQVWNAGLGVISLHCFQNVIPVEAYTREACMVEAIGLKMLTNQKRGDFYGTVSNWDLKRKRKLGVHLLYRAMQIFLAEGERQLRPADIRQ